MMSRLCHPWEAFAELAANGGARHPENGGGGVAD